MKTTIYENYGVLGREYINTYTEMTEHAHAIYSEKIEVEIPEKLNPYKTVWGETGLDINGKKYVLGELLRGDQYPKIKIPGTERYINLKITKKGE